MALLKKLCLIVKITRCFSIICKQKYVLFQGDHSPVRGGQRQSHKYSQIDHHNQSQKRGLKPLYDHFFAKQGGLELGRDTSKSNRIK